MDVLLRQIGKDEDLVNMDVLPEGVSHGITQEVQSLILDPELVTNMGETRIDIMRALPPGITMDPCGRLYEFLSWRIGNEELPPRALEKYPFVAEYKIQDCGGIRLTGHVQKHKLAA